MVATLLTTGCFEQDYQDCPPPNNLVLKLDLQSNEAASLFAEKVNSIDVFVYDVSDRPAIYKRVTKEEQGGITDLSFTVVPGMYQIVCWANVGRETHIVGPTGEWPLNECYLEIISPQTGNPLYYAPSDGTYEVAVLPNQITTKEMLFMRAHRTIRVYLKGYETVYEALPPVISFSNMPVRSDFFMRTGLPRKTYEALAATVETKDGPRMMAAFNFLIAPFADDMLIEIIKTSTGEVVTEVNLKQYVDENAAKIDDLNDFGIEIRYLMNGSVEIVLTDWKEINLEPQW